MMTVVRTKRAVGNRTQSATELAALYVPRPITLKIAEGHFNVLETVP